MQRERTALPGAPDDAAGINDSGSMVAGMAFSVFPATFLALKHMGSEPV